MAAPTFGSLLKHLRTERGLSQQALAASAKCSMQTIRRAEQTGNFTWKRSTAIDVLSALEKQGPLNDSQAADYMRFTKLEAVARVGREMLERHRQERIAIGESIASKGFAYTTRDDTAASLAHTWLQEAIDAPGVDIERQILPAIETLGRALGANLSRRDQGPQYWAYHHPTIHTGDGFTTRVITPIPVSPPAKPKAQPKRKSG